MSTFQQIESACDYQTNNVIIVSVSATNVFGHGPAINTSIGNYYNLLYDIILIGINIVTLCSVFS